jgi:hypothetical protein
MADLTARTSSGRVLHRVLASPASESLQASGSAVQKPDRGILGPVARARLQIDKV